MFTSLPHDVQSLLHWTWAEIEPYFQDLSDRPLSPATVGEWLADWTQLDDRTTEMYTRLYLATTVDTADADAEEAFHAFLDAVYQKGEAADQKLKEKLLASGLEPEGFREPLRRMQAEAGIFRQANLPLLTEERKLSAEYDKIIAAETVEWQGKETTVSQLRPVYLNPDRNAREQAWRLASDRQLADREAIDQLWRKFLDLRQRLAANADQRTYRDYRWQQLLRFDYTPADCVTFQRAIEKAVVPAAQRVYDKRRKRLGVRTLRPWDLEVDPLGRPPLKPFSRVSELKEIAASIFHRVDPKLGDYFDTMVRESLLDLDNRKNKAPGGYCTSFPMSRRPFIFANAVGLHDDLQTVLHESGHAFHSFERYALPYAQQRHNGMEFAEVASMSMELLAAPYLATDAGGIYSRRDAARARIEHLEKNILFWPYMAVVDAFQQWVYENPSASADPPLCDAQWDKQWKRFMPGVDWSGLEQERVTGWHRKLHIHQLPFYYVEYGLAQLGAMQIWRNALSDQAAAVASYRRALALGGTVSLPQLYSAAGARFAFDAKTLGAAVRLAEETVEALEQDA